jgi:hypothetical protein
MASAPMLIDFWVAEYAGRVYLRLRPSQRRVWGDSSAACSVLAHGGELPGGELRKTQIFAAIIWFLLSVSSILLGGVVGFSGALLPNGWLWNAVGDLMAVLLAIGVVAIAQMAMINYRRTRSHRYLLRGGRASLGQPLPPGAGGLPRRRDFWVVLVVMLVLCYVLLMQALHANPSGQG